MTQTVSKEEEVGENKTLPLDPDRLWKAMKRERWPPPPSFAASSLNAIVMRRQAARVRRTGHRSKKTCAGHYRRPRPR